MMKRVLPAAAVAALLSGQALAQDAGPPTEAPDPKAMHFSVSPSGHEAPNEDQARQERLLKRMEQADYAVRSICVSCGDSWKHQTYAPFNPLADLHVQGSEGEE
jgi:hypothetical protein